MIRIAGEIATIITKVLFSYVWSVGLPPRPFLLPFANYMEDEDEKYDIMVKQNIWNTIDDYCQP